MNGQQNIVEYLLHGKLIPADQ